jgi:hypothetical protein
MGFLKPCIAANFSPFEFVNSTGDHVHLDSIRWELSQIKIVVYKYNRSELDHENLERGNRLIRLPLDGITSLYVRELGADVLLAFENDIGGDGSGMLCRMATKSAFIRWCRPIRGFNIFASLSSDGSIFVGAIGLVARIDAKTGKIIWQQSGLYKRDNTFLTFCAAEEDEGVVSMIGANGGRAGKRITLNRHTGQILSISEKTPGDCRAGQYIVR